MRTMVASFAFVLPFSITYHLAESRACHRIRKEGGNKSQIAPVIGGLLSGGAVSLAGNMHYVIYGCIRQWLGLNESAYWFPSSTRYIGYDPLVEMTARFMSSIVFLCARRPACPCGECHVRPAGAGPFIFLREKYLP